MGTGPELTPKDVARFWSKVDRQGSAKCWPWLASVNVRGGYGQFRKQSYTLRAHVVSYVLTVGPVPDGHVLDHLCRNRRCVNPSHLDPVRLGENTRRGMSPAAIAVRLNRCYRGHEFTPENTIIRPNRPGKRECRTCENARQRRRYYQQKKRI